ncbi:putative motility protein YjfB-like [Lachnotalea glycerini]|uniref:Putative motility protein n=1 Tax=Lachnotalea glycerini TaxID=1763509 RepID=A0A255IKS9_9FIRM|nr:YjfB family protein [Lachnotalea glycerini]PXV90143.1 putative motility protein YjfB-like [Lachnotalea glycerini]RDY31795.1 putative motility protein [Lachnotalea glycerini]
MDIASLSMELSQNKVMNQVSTALLSKSLDMAEDLTANVTDMIDTMPTPSASPEGIGTMIDITL